MPTFYIIVILIPICGFFISNRISSKFNFFDIFNSIITALLLSIRSNVGVDLETYRLHYNYFLYSLRPPVPFFDKGYALLESSFANFDLPFNILLFVISFFNLSVLIYFCKTRILNYKILALSLFFTTFDIYIYSLSAIRQSIAISFIFIAVMFLEKKKYFKFFVSIFLSSQFHWTAIGVLPIYLFIFLFSKIRAIYLLILPIIIPSIYLFLVKSPIYSVIASINKNTTYYLDIISKSEGYSSIRDVFIWVIIAEIFIFYMIFLENINENGKVLLYQNNLLSKININFERWSVLIFLLLHICVDTFYISALPRFEMYFYIFLPFVVSKEVEKFSKKLNYLIMPLLILLFVILLFFKIQTNSIYYGNANFYIP